MKVQFLENPWGENDLNSECVPFTTGRWNTEKEVELQLLTGSVSLNR